MGSLFIAKNKKKCTAKKTFFLLTFRDGANGSKVHPIGDGGGGGKVGGGVEGGPGDGEGAGGGGAPHIVGGGWGSCGRNEFIFYKNGFFFLTEENVSAQLVPCRFSPPALSHPSKDMQNPPPLRTGHLYMKDAQCAETNEKSYFRFLVFDLLVVKELPIRLQKNNFFQKWPNLQGQLGLN